MSHYRGWIGILALLAGVASSLAQVPEPRTQPGRQPIRETPIARHANPPSPAAGVPSPTGFASLQPRPFSLPSGSAGIAATFVVTTTEDTGDGSLRKAIEDANDSPGWDVIEFQLTGPRVVISPQSPLPLITDQLTIDGTTAPGYFTAPSIQIDGAQAGASFGLYVDAAGCVIRGLSITRFSNSGIVLLGASTTIDGCYIGVEPDGGTAGGNGVDGITVLSATNHIGRAGARPNVISGNGRSGVVIDGSGAGANIVENCYAGTNAAATAAIPNTRWGVEVVNATDVLVGGLTSGARNILSGNGNAGVGVRGTNANRVKVQGNYVGVGLDPAVAIPNQNHGVEIAPAAERGTPGAPSNVLVGGVWNSPERNLISGNVGAGVALFLATDGGTGLVVAGNIIGLDAGMAIAVPNQYGITVRRDNATGLMPGARIGGIRVDSANVVAGNSLSGMYLMGAGGRNNMIRGNYIGVVPLPGGSFLPHGNTEAGIVLDGSGGNEIGGPDTLSGNVIGANGYGGMQIYGDNSAGTTIINNYIGTAPGRPRTIGNGFSGIYVEAPGITIGKINPDNSIDANIVAWNAHAGIYIGSGQGNSLRGNAIYRNGTLGIDLGGGGLTPNDTTDGDTGANTLLNYPIIESVTENFADTRISFRILGEPYKTYTVDFYTNDVPGASVFGEGKEIFGWTTVTTGSDGSGVWTTTILKTVPNGEKHITAMATDADGNSSEFCRAFCLEDSDKDGLMDCWEKQGVGIDLDMNGLVDLDLYARGANWDHKDLFVEVDRMAEMEFAFPAREMAEASFRTAPNTIVNNPDHRDGISLHIQYVFLDDSIAKAPWPANPWVEFHAAKKTHFGTDLERQHPNAEMLLKAKRLAYRYCIFANRYGASGSGGLAEGIGGNDFMVTLGNWWPVIGGTVEEQAGTFVHELGHTLGLRHGGGDNINYKPNYVSVMNYCWQFPRPSELDNKLTWRIVFSPSALPALNESNLDETLGLSVPEGIFPGTVFPYGNAVTGYRTGVLFPGAAVDWDGDKDSTGAGGNVQVDLNGKGGNSPGELLLSHNDWSHILYNFRALANFPDPGPGVSPAPSATLADEEPEMDWMTRDSLAKFPPYGFVPPERVPYFNPRDTNAVGGNWGGVPLYLSIAAPVGGLQYYFRSSAPDLMSVDRLITYFEGNTEATVGFNTIGVEQDTTVYILSDSLILPLYARVHIRAASLSVLNARGDSGCVITEPGGFRKRFLAGCTILLEASLDGQAPSSGGTIHLVSSRPDLLPVPDASPIAPFGTAGLIPVKSTASISSPQMVILTATYRDSTRCDTVIIMPAPRYTFTQFGSGGSSGTSTLKLNNAGDVLVNWYMIYRDGDYVYPSSLPGNRLNSITGMNDLGWLCGTVLDSTEAHQMPAYWKPDTTIALPVYGGAYPYGATRGINNRGDVIGFCEGKNWPYRQKPTLWKNDAAIELEEYGDFWLEVIDLNESDQIVGTGRYSMGFPTRRIGLRWDDAVLTMIEHPDNPLTFVDGVAMAEDGTGLIWSGQNYWMHLDSLSSHVVVPPPFYTLQPFAMNDSLHVVGRLEKQVGEGRTYSAFVFRDGYQYDLTCLGLFPAGWTNTTATGINNSGTIVGYGWQGGRMRFFLLTPSGANDVTDPELPQLVPTEFRLSQNYPNPFNPSTVIRYALPQEVDVHLEVFSILGQRVRTLVDGRQRAGEYEVQLEGSSLASGVYFYRLRAGSFVQMQKMILMK